MGLGGVSTGIRYLCYKPPPNLARRGPIYLPPALITGIAQ